MASDGAVHTTYLTDAQADLLGRVKRVLPLLADIVRADALLSVPDAGSMRLVLHARPHSIAPVHRQIPAGDYLSRSVHPIVFETLEQNRPFRRLRSNPQAEGAPVLRETFPVRASGRAIAVLVIDTNLLETERLRRRNPVFQKAIRDLKWMAARGEPAGTDPLSPFGEYDGLIFADAQRVVRYLSGIATNLYRNIGYTESMIGKPLAYLETVDDELAREALESRSCVERELEERGRTWIKKAIPLETIHPFPVLTLSQPRCTGVLLAIHDDTEARERAREHKIKTTMIKEVHHRVKNDLQTVAALLRMQARRVQTDEARGALSEAVNRILSIAVIHEFLSDQDSRIINIRDMAQRILNQMQAGVLGPGRDINLKLKGPNIYLPARQATSCALVINELLQNALEHGYDLRGDAGTVSLSLEDGGDRVTLRVHDDGRGLPDDFDLEHVDSLGLRIVRMLVTEDLNGHIEMQSDNGVSAIVNFPKIPLGGEGAWSEQGS